MKRKMILQSTVLLCGIFIWWGNLFPEFTWNTEVCRVYDLESRTELEDLTGEDLYEAILHAKPEEIKLESKLLEMWKALWTKWSKREH